MHDFRDLGFTIELPDDWQESRHTVNLGTPTKHLFSDKGTIRIMVGEVRDEFRSAESRRGAYEQELLRTGCTDVVATSRTLILGGEANTVVSDYVAEGERRARTISVVRGVMEYIIEYIGTDRSDAGNQDLQQLIHSFVFTRQVTPKDLSEPYERLSPQQRAVLRALAAEDVEKKRSILREAGMSEIQGRGYTMHRVSDDVNDQPKPRRKWWQFWR